MGARGPLPKARKLSHGGKDKRDQPMRRLPARRADMPRPEASPDWEPVVRSWYNSLALSGQSAAYEPSDWALAVVGAEVLNEALTMEKMNASLINEFNAISARLASAVGDRLRARIELTPSGEGDTDEAAAVTDMNDWRRKMEDKP